MESRTIKILAIDDNPDNLITLKALIKEAFPDSLIFTALNGTRGLELASAENPDVILLDIVMPGMDGFDLCQLLKADKYLCNIPVIFITALKRSDCPPELIIDLFQSKDDGIRLEIAKHANTPTNILLHLTNDKNKNIQNKKEKS